MRPQAVYFDQLYILAVRALARYAEYGSSSSFSDAQAAVDFYNRRRLVAKRYVGWPKLRVPRWPAE